MYFKKLVNIIMGYGKSKIFRVGQQARDPGETDPHLNKKGIKEFEAMLLLQHNIPSAYKLFAFLSPAEYTCLPQDPPKVFPIIPSGLA